MSRMLFVPLPGNDRLAGALAAALDGEVGSLETRRFPDQETYVRLRTEVKDRSVAIVCTLDRPDGKFLPLAFTAGAVRELGAAGVGLVAPYLAYMRQDRRFHEGEAVTSGQFARLLSTEIDWLVTVDPHLHRYGALGDIYTVPTRVVHAAPALADWIRKNVDRPVIVGPDAESEQWVASVASRARAPYAVLRKQRHGDRDVEISLPDLRELLDRTPVLVDDIVSSARTMIEASRQLQAAGLPEPVCVAVHGIFSEGGYRALRDVAGRIVSTDTVLHETNAIGLSELMAAQVRTLAATVPTDAPPGPAGASPRPRVP